MTMENEWRGAGIPALSSWLLHCEPPVTSHTLALGYYVLVSIPKVTMPVQITDLIKGKHSSNI